MSRLDSVISELRGDDSAKELVRVLSKASATLMITLPEEDPRGPVDELPPNGTILFASARLEELFGWIEGQLQGRNIDVLIPERFRAKHKEHLKNFSRSPSNRAMGGGGSALGKFLGLRRDGKEIPLEIGITATSYAGLFCGVATIVQSRGESSPTGGCPVAHG